MQLLRYDTNRIFDDQSDVDQSELTALGDRLNAARDQTLADVELRRSGTLSEEEQKQLDSKFVENLCLPRLDPASIGQLFQMLMLATVVEGRLLGINPHGQPGVEAYKKNMLAILRGELAINAT